MRRFVLCIALCIVMLIPVVVTAAAFPLPLPVQQESSEASGEADPEATNQEESEPATAESVTIESSSDPASAADSGESSKSQDENYEDLVTGKFCLEGEWFQLPCPVKDIMAMGWQPRDDEADGTFFSMGSIETFSLYKGDSKIKTDIRPIRENELAFVEGEIFRIDNFIFRDYALPPIVYPGNISITQGSTREDVIAAYGEPHTIDFNEKGEAYLYNYITPSHSRGSDAANFAFDPSTGFTVGSINLQQEAPIWPEEKIDGLNVIYASDVEPYEPAESPDSLEPLALQLNGQTLTFPFPVAELLKAGWQIADYYDAESDWSPYTEKEVIFRKGRSRLRTEVRNLSERETVSFEACYVISIELGQRPSFMNRYAINDQCELEIAGGLTLGMTRDDLADWLAQDQVEIKSEYDYPDHTIPSQKYKVKVGEMYVHIEVEGLQGTVCRIVLVNSGKMVY